jgi:hypothetical protein
MEWTDKTITIECGQCSEPIEGFDPMVSHIIMNHEDYSPAEAKQFARLWCDQAYEREEEFDIAYAEYRAIDRAIEADAFPEK